MRLTKEEMETAFVQSAEDRANGIWHVFTCDAYWQKRLAKYGKLEKQDGLGYWYTIEHKQLSFRKPKSMIAPRKAPTHGFIRKNTPIEETTNIARKDGYDG